MSCMKWLSRVNGYTITELIVAMLISGMVITYSISTSFFVKERYSIQSDGYFNTMDFIRIKHDLTRCFDESDEIYFSDSTLTFRFKNANVVTYRFQDSITLRNQHNFTDTFYISTTNILPVFKPETPLLAEIHVGFTVKTETRVSLFKHYPIDIFIRNHIDKPRLPSN